jgi:hypothetical protein
MQFRNGPKMPFPQRRLAYEGKPSPPYNLWLGLEMFGRTLPAQWTRNKPVGSVSYR